MVLISDGTGWTPTKVGQLRASSEPIKHCARMLVSCDFVDFHEVQILIAGKPLWFHIKKRKKKKKEEKNKQFAEVPCDALL